MSRVRRAHSPISPRLVGAGAAGIAAMFALAPPAGAATTPHPISSDAPTDPGHGATAHKAKATAADDAAPDFGLQKFRVGVQIKDGAYVPDGTTTVGSAVHIVETNDTGDVVNDQTCTTDASTQEDLPSTSTTTFCLFPEVGAARRARALGLGVPRDIPIGLTEQYTAFPGDTVTLTQTETASPALLIDPAEPQTVPPVVCGVDGCPDHPDVTFVDPGLPPEAVDDHATTQIGEPVDIAVLGNDDSKGAPTTVDVTSQPAHGTAEAAPLDERVRRPRAANGTQTITYTPASGFFGDDEFTYKITTANGTSSAHVFVTIPAPPPTAVDDSATTKMATPVSIAITKNDDDNGVPPLTVTSAGTPHHGTVRLHGTTAVYTPNDDFAGVDKFPYTISTPGGTDSAIVTVTVAAVSTPTPVPLPTSATRTPTPTPSPSSSDQALAVTGAPISPLTELGAVLLAAGGLATAVGRRRRRRGHHS
jgi:Bacterial Ig domain